MRTSRNTLIATGVGLVLILGIFFAASGVEKPASGVVLFTMIPESTPDLFARFPEGARIGSVDPSTPDAPARVLTTGFYSARAPRISFDGRTLLFAGQKQKGGPWQIWEADVDGSNMHPMTPDCRRCTDPVYLPDGRIAWAGAVDVSDTLFALFTGHPDSTSARRISFLPSSSYPAALLSDGRILYHSIDSSRRQLFAVRYDGTGSELVLDAQVPGAIRSGVDHRLVFAEGGRLYRIMEVRPTTSRESLSDGFPGQFLGAASGPEGHFFAAYREGTKGRYQLVDFDAEGRRVAHTFRVEGAYHVTEPVCATAVGLPVGFVSMIDPAVDFGTYFVNSVYHTGDAVDSSLIGRIKSVRIHTPGRVLGDVPVERDGSIHVEVPSDTPVRFETITAEGNRVGEPSAWLWIRPGEMRGCIGCHENRELAPENKIPIAITKPAISLVPRTVAAGTPRGEDIH